MKEYSFSFGKEVAKEIAVALGESLRTYNKRKRKYKKTGEPIIVCVGSDLAIFDSLGPLCGTLLKQKHPEVRLFGCLERTQNARNIKKTNAWLKKEYGDSPIIAIDAAVTNEDDLGAIKVQNKPLSPGAGAGKKLGEVGQITVLGLTANKIAPYVPTVRLGMVYSMADTISSGVAMFLEEWKKASV